METWSRLEDMTIWTSMFDLSAIQLFTACADDKVRSVLDIFEFYSMARHWRDDLPALLPISSILFELACDVP